MSGSWQAERGSRRTRRHPRDNPRAEVGEDVGVGPVEFQLNAVHRSSSSSAVTAVTSRHQCRDGRALNQSPTDSCRQSERLVYVS